MAINHGLPIRQRPVVALAPINAVKDTGAPRQNDEEHPCCVGRGRGCYSAVTAQPPQAPSPTPSRSQRRPRTGRLPAQAPIRAGAARNRAHPMATRRPSQPSPPSYPRSIPIRPSPPTYPLQPDLSFPFPMPTPHSAPAPEPASRAELRSRPTANACASESEHTQIARFPLPVLSPLPVLRCQSSPAKCRCGSLTVFASGIGKEIASDGLTVKSSTAR